MATTDSLGAIITWLAGRSGWPAGVALHGVELPAGWQPSSTALVLAEGGQRDLDIPVITPIVSIWCYGTTAETAADVANALAGLIHRAAVASITLGGKTVYVGPGEIITEPVYLREPETLWHRWIVRAAIRVSENPI